MSPKLSSLAYEELKEQSHEEMDESFAPKLNLHIGRNGMLRISSSLAASSEEAVRISGRITISF